MPKRTRSSYRKRPRTSKRRKFSSRKRPRYNQSIQRMSMMSTSQIVTMKYVTQITIDPPIGGVGTHVFTANGIFDPDITGTGHQPMGRDEWATFYDHYTVIGSKCKARFLSPSTNTSTGVGIVGILLKDSNNLLTNATTIMEQGRTKYKVMTGSSSGTPYQTITKGYSPKRFFGFKDLRDNRATVGAQYGVNPSEQAYFHVYIAPFGGGDDVASVKVLVEVEYKCLLTEPKTVLAS